MNAVKSCPAPERAEKLLRRNTRGSLRESVVSTSGLKAHKKKERQSVIIITAEEEISHDNVGPVQEDEESTSEPVPVVPSLISQTESENLLKMTVKDMERTLQEKFELTAETDLRDAILLDYYVAAAYWAQQQKYTVHQLSDFFTVMHALIHAVIDDHASMVELIKDLHTMLNEGGRECRYIDKGLQCFSKEEKKALVGYLYSRNQAEEIIVNELSVELLLPAETPFPPGLDEGMSESVMNDYLPLATPPSEAEVPDITGTPSDMEMHSELADVFAKLTPLDVKNIINETSALFLSNLQADFESKIKTQEATALGKITKIRGEASSNTAIP